MPKISVSPTESRNRSTPYESPFSAWANRSAGMVEQEVTAWCGCLSGEQRGGGRGGGAWGRTSRAHAGGGGGGGASPGRVLYRARELVRPPRPPWTSAQR